MLSLLPAQSYRCNPVHLLQKECKEEMMSEEQEKTVERTPVTESNLPECFRHADFEYPECDLCSIFDSCVGASSIPDAK